MLVQHELTRSPACGGNSKSVYCVIQARLEKLKEHLTGNALTTCSFCKHVSELSLEQSIDVLSLLLFCKLYCVFRLLALLTATVHTRRIVLLLKSFVLTQDRLIKSS